MIVSNNIKLTSIKLKRFNYSTSSEPFKVPQLLLEKKARRPQGIEDRFHNGTLTDADMAWVSMCLTNNSTKKVMHRRGTSTYALREFINCPVLNHYSWSQLPQDWIPTPIDRPDGIEKRYDSNTRTSEDNRWIIQESTHVTGSLLWGKTLADKAKRKKCPVLKARAKEIRTQETAIESSNRKAVKEFIGCNPFDISLPMPEGFETRAPVDFVEEDRRWIAGEAFYPDGSEKSSVSIINRAKDLNSNFLVSEAVRSNYCFRRKNSFTDFPYFLYEKGRSRYVKWNAKTFKTDTRSHSWEDACGVGQEEWTHHIRCNRDELMIDESFGKPSVEKGDVDAYHYRVATKPSPTLPWEIAHIWALYWWDFLGLDIKNLADVRFMFSWSNVIGVSRNVNLEMALEHGSYATPGDESFLVWCPERMVHVVRETNELPTGVRIPIQSPFPSNFVSNGSNWPATDMKRHLN